MWIRPLASMRRIAYCTLCMASALLAPCVVQGEEILVSAATSLTEAFGEIGKRFTKIAPQTVVRFNFGASGALQTQIEQGAPVDVFASASSKEMEALQGKGLVAKGAPFAFVGNRLVLIAGAQGQIRGWKDLATGAVKRIALSNPNTVPSGRYAKETLTKRGVWEAVQPKLVFGENVRQTLAYVVNGDADAGLVFETDARAFANRVRVVAVAETGRDHTAIRYFATALGSAPNRSMAQRFVSFLQSKEAQAVLKSCGFSPLSLPRKPLSASQKRGRH